MGHHEWGTLFTNAGISPEHFYRPPFHNERYLSEPRRIMVNSLVAETARAFTDIHMGEPSAAPIVAAYERLLAALWTEFRTACEKYGIEYMEAVEL